MHKARSSRRCQTYAGVTLTLLLLGSSGSSRKPWPLARSALRRAEGAARTLVDWIVKSLSSSVPESVQSAGWSRFRNFELSLSFVLGVRGVTRHQQRGPGSLQWCQEHLLAAHQLDETVRAWWLGHLVLNVCLEVSDVYTFRLTSNSRSRVPLHLDPGEVLAG